MPNLILTYLPSDLINVTFDVFFFRSTPLRRIDNGEIVGNWLNRTYAQETTTIDGQQKFFKPVEISLNLFDLNPNLSSTNNQLNVLNGYINFYAEKKESVFSPGQTYKTKLTCSTLDISPDAELTIQISNDGKRVLNIVY